MSWLMALLRKLLLASASLYPKTSWTVHTLELLPTRLFQALLKCSKELFVCGLSSIKALY